MTDTQAPSGVEPAADAAAHDGAAEVARVDAVDSYARRIAREAAAGLVEQSEVIRGLVSRVNALEHRAGPMDPATEVLLAEKIEAAEKEGAGS